MSKLEKEKINKLWKNLKKWINSKRILGILISAFIFLAPELGINVEAINDLINLVIGTSSTIYDTLVGLIPLVLAFWETAKKKWEEITEDIN